MPDLNKLARERYGVDFDKLSSFAQNDLMQRAFIAHNVGAREVDLIRAVAIANEKVAKLERENKDLWRENEELKIENLGITDELNKNSSRRRT